MVTREYTLVGHFLTLVKDPDWTIQVTLAVSYIISKLYRSCDLFVCLFGHVFLIPCNDIRPVFILNVLLYSLVKYDILCTHSVDRSLRKGCYSYTRTHGSDNTRYRCPGSVSSHCASKRYTCCLLTKLGFPWLVSASVASLYRWHVC